MTPNAKTTWPFDDCHLTPNGNGQWSKKFRGKVYYFGPHSDPEGARRRFYAEWPAILSGTDPRPVAPREAPSVKQVADAWVESKAQAMERAELAPQTFRKYREFAQFITDTFGARRNAATLGPRDFAVLLTAAAQRMDLLRRADFVSATRSLFKWAFDAEELPSMVRFGPDFRGPKAKVRRLHKQAMGKRMFTAAEIRRLLRRAKGQLRAFVLLGINTGMGQNEIARLTREVVNLDAGIIDSVRAKTGSPRLCPLWPETVAAMRAVKRLPPELPEHADRFFLTGHGRPWVRPNADPLGEEFDKLLEASKLKRKGWGFYILRRTHRTISGQVKDTEAADLIMGHITPGQGPHYVQEIGLDRLRHVTDHIRRWLFGRSPTRAAAASRGRGARKRAAAARPAGGS